MLDNVIDPSGKRATATRRRLSISGLCQLKVGYRGWTREEAAGALNLLSAMRFAGGAGAGVSSHNRSLLAVSNTTVVKCRTESELWKLLDAVAQGLLLVWTGSLQG